MSMHNLHTYKRMCSCTHTYIQIVIYIHIYTNKERRTCARAYHQYLISRFISLPPPVLYLPYLSQYYIFPTSPSTISSLPLPVLYLPYLSQYYIFSTSLYTTPPIPHFAVYLPTSPSTVSSLPPSFPCPIPHFAVYLPTSPSTVSSLPLPVLYLPYLPLHHTTNTSFRVLSPYLSQYCIFPTSPSTISSLPPSPPHH